VIDKTLQIDSDPIARVLIIDEGDHGLNIEPSIYNKPEQPQ